MIYIAVNNVLFNCFCDQPYHMIAASLNAFYNVYLGQQLPAESGFTITVNNHPLPRNIDTQVDVVVILVVSDENGLLRYQAHLDSTSMEFSCTD